MATNRLLLPCFAYNEINNVELSRYIGANKSNSNINSNKL